MPDADLQLSERVLSLCRAQGFALAGITPALPSDRASEYREWIASGKHGEMAYLARNVEERLDPRRLLPGAKSIIVVADQYAVRGEPTTSTSRSPVPPIGCSEPIGALTTATAPESGRKPEAGSRKPGLIARYAQGRDYHDVMKKRLHAIADALRAEQWGQGHEFRSFVDTAPVLEREHAARAGLGWIGKHTLLINPRLGSWLFLGGILTTLDIPIPSDQQPIPDHCGTCTRCIDACPTKAITPHSVNATRCISYLTIEHRSPINPQLHSAIGDWLYGCDICQEVCPHNSPRPDGTIDTGTINPDYAPKRDSFDLLEVLNWTEDDRRRAVRGTAMTRAKLDMFHRNAMIARANHQPAVIPAPSPSGRGAG
ncbi:MAG TPA: tRNA epoxyqueuosine(34) reductase QueG [Phycisphaerales bacterium]|nr:tRNA epoxyqueuosine(34) reductase QueG [Phycisphaerales bacterium]